MTTIDEYLDKCATPSQRKQLERIRKIVKQTVPEAEEAISYGMPAFTFMGKQLFYFAAFKHHMSTYGNFDAVEDRISGFKQSKKGTLQFTEDNPLPEDVIVDIVLARKAKILEG